MPAALVAAAAVAPLPAAAQDVQGWSQLSLVAEVADGWFVNAEASGRTRAEEREEQVLLRFQAGRALSDRLTVWLGYVRAETLEPVARNGLEQRATLQADWDAATLGDFRLALRTRVEGRFQRGTDEASWRFREQIRLIRDVGKVQLAAGVEPFLALNRTAAARRTFEQLRFTANVLVPLTGEATLDLGYINQQLYRAGEQPVNHVIPVTLRLTL